MGMTDIHSHFAWGVDDGAKDKETMCRMIDCAAATGVTTLYATPHATPGIMPFPEEQLAVALTDARDYIAEKRYDIHIVSGAEILWNPAAEWYTRDRKLPTLGNTDIVLVEFPGDIKIRELEEAADLLTANAYHPILAHVERYANLFMPRAARKLKEGYELSFQMNANTLLRRHGLIHDMTMDRWIRDGLIDCIGSDAHDPHHRPILMKEAYDALNGKYGRETADRLTGKE